jgi:hypothetical protein
MGWRPEPAGPTDGARSRGNTQQMAETRHSDQPLNRRRAMRVLSALAAAAAGAAVLDTGRPEEARANSATYSDNSSTAILSATNAGTGPAVEGENADGGKAIFGHSAGTILSGGYGVYGAWSAGSPGP